MSTISGSPTPAAAMAYVNAGLALVAFDRGSKGPRHKGWNLLENCITDVAVASNLYGNIGLAHVPSHTCCVDIDDMALAVEWFGGAGIDLTEYWLAPDAVRLTSGLPNRGKLLYRLPVGIEALPTRMFKGDGVELRCATAAGLTVQDVLPPSTHPDTGKEYAWIGPGTFRDIPIIPPDLLNFWQALAAPKEAGSHTPAGLGREDIEGVLKRIRPDELPYSDWLHVGMALHHECSGDHVGLDLWDDWSIGDGRNRLYKGRAELESKWQGFNDKHPEPRTLRTIERMAGPVDMRSEYEDLGPTTKPAVSVETVETVETVKKPTFKIETPDEFLNCEYEDDFIDGVLPDMPIGAATGQTQSGKTFAIMDLVFAMARRVRWRGRETKPARVLYIAAEGAVGLRKRIKAYAQHHGIAPGDINVEFMADAPDLTKKADVLALIADIQARIAEKGEFTHIIIDTWSQVTAGADENSGRDMGRALKAIKAIHKETGARILFVAHMGKDPSKGLRGWSGVKAALDYEIEISRNGEQRLLTVSKARDGEDGISFAFHLQRVTLLDATTKRGKPVISCVLVHDIAPPKRPPVSKVQLAVLATVDAYCEAKNGAWMSFAEVLQNYRKRMMPKQPKKQPKKDQSATAVKRGLLQLVKNNWLEEKDGNYRPFTIAVDL